jgi:AcrR family transcriptional regulator
VTAATEVRRTRNRRGEGAQLRDDIVSAAGTLLEQTGRDDAVTLRAIARTIGITAPSIYDHFEDRNQILVALVTRTFDQLTDALRPAADTVDDPVAKVRAVARAYLAVATDHAHLYRVLFERHHAAGTHRHAPAGVDGMVGAQAFAVLLDAVRACVDSGDSTATSAEHAATQWWVGLHGLSTLRASMPYFPWPPLESQLDDLTDRLLQLRAPRPQRRRRPATG